MSCRWCLLASAERSLLVLSPSLCALTRRTSTRSTRAAQRWRRCPPCSRSSTTRRMETLRASSSKSDGSSSASLWSEPNPPLYTDTSMNASDSPRCLSAIVTRRFASLTLALPVGVHSQSHGTSALIDDCLYAALHLSMPSPPPAPPSPPPSSPPPPPSPNPLHLHGSHPLPADCYCYLQSAATTRGPQLLCIVCSRALSQKPSTVFGRCDRLLFLDLPSPSQPQTRFTLSCPMLMRGSYV